MRTGVREKANKAKDFVCKNLIVVLENPKNLVNIGSVIRNINVLGAEKLYVVDGFNIMPANWEEMRERRKLNDVSASAIKWTFVRKFNNSEECLNHLKKKSFISAITSPHQKGKKNFILHHGDYTQKKLAVWFGNEARGISNEVAAQASFCINIPVCGIIESLNLATTTGIVLYEITTQRREFTRCQNLLKNMQNFEKDSMEKFLKFTIKIK